MTLTQLLFTFEGRIGRKAWWFGFVVLLAAGLAASLVDWALFRSEDGLASIVVGLASFLAGIALSVKRWHDRDKSGWWYLILFVPVIGGIWMIVENGFLSGTAGPNRFGPDPLGPAWSPPGA